MKNSHEDMSDVADSLCVGCAWKRLLEIADAGVATGETLRYIATKLLDEHPDDGLGSAVAGIADTLLSLRNDIERARAVNFVTPDMAEGH